METKVYTIGQICKRFSSGKFISADKIYDLEQYPVFGGNGLRGYTNIHNFEGECTIIGRQGAYCGNVRYFNGKGYMTDHAVVAVTKEEHNNKFFSYKLGLADLGRFSGQAAQPGLSVTKIARLRLAMPSFPIQQKIASILSTYDNLIENNTKRIKLLEQMAENLYKEWFVRFRFPGHENVGMENGLPKGWKTYSLKELCIINGKTISSKRKNKLIHYLDTSSITDNNIIGFEDYILEDAPSRAKRIVKNNSIIFSTVRPNLRHIGIMKQPVENTIVSTGFAVFDCKYDIANIIYRFLSSQEIVDYCQSIAEGAVATYPSIKSEEIGRIKIALPKMEIVQEIDAIFEQLIKEQNVLSIQNQLLTKQRDLLLPRLMSGKLEVKA